MVRNPDASGSPSAHISPEGMYGIYAELKVYLAPKLGLKQPPAGLLGRIEKHVEREVESLTSTDFLTKIQRVLEQVGMKRVLILNKNDIVIFLHDQEKEENWSKAFETALQSGSSPKKWEDQWWMLVSGWNDDFKFRQDIAFKEKHTLAAPSMSIVIRALPAEWALQSKEDFDSWMLRLRRIMRDKEGVKAEEIRTQPKIEKYIQDYERVIKDVFAVRDCSHSVRISLSQIDLESFRENYSYDQAS